MGSAGLRRVADNVANEGGGIFVYQGGAAITGVTMNTNSPDDVNAGGSHSYTYSGVVTTICNSTQCQ